MQTFGKSTRNSIVLRSPEKSPSVLQIIPQILVHRNLVGSRSSINLRIVYKSTPLKPLDVNED